MEVAVGFGIVVGIIIALLSGKNKRRSDSNRPSGAATKLDHKQLQKADEELITVILPNINKDK